MTGSLSPLNLAEVPAADPVRTFWRRHAVMLFQEPFWIDVIARCYGHRTSLFKVKDGPRMVGLLPLVNIRNKYHALPFLDYTAPVCDPDEMEPFIHELAVFWKSGAFACHLRSLSPFDFGALVPDTGNVTLRLELAGNEDVMWKGFDPKVRNQVRKPGKNGVAVREGDAALSAFYGVWAAHISRLGTPVHPFRFFREVFNAIPPERRRLVTAWHEDEVVGGLVLLFDENTAYVPWAASRFSLRPLCLNHALYWNAMQTAIREGKRTFDFLRSRPGSGTYAFKRQWGAVETPLYYYDTDGKGDPRGHTGYGLGSAVWRKLPLAISTRLGPCLRKFIP